MLDNGIRPEILSFSSHTAYLTDTKLYKSVLQGRKRRELANDLGLGLKNELSFRGIKKFAPSVQEAVSEARVKPSSYESYELAWVSFPPALYRRVLLSRIAKHVFVNISHRFDLYKANYIERLDFHEQVTKDFNSGQVTFFAANEYDKRYFEYYTGLSIELMKPYFPELNLMKQAKRDSRDFPILIGPAHLDLKQEVLQKLIKNLYTRFGFELKGIKQVYSTYRLADLVEHKAFIVIPYSTYSISISELAALGVPLLFPTDRWLNDSGLLQDVRLWPVYAEKSEIMKFYKDLDPRSPNSETFTNEWLQFASWKYLPNVWYWDSVEELFELIQLLEKIDRSTVNENQLNYEALMKEKYLSLVNSLK
jgi:hypothetical protein